MPKRTHDGIKKRCSCSRRQWPKCSHPWWFNFYFRGQEHRYSLDRIAHARGAHPPTTKSDAIIWRDRLRNEIRAGTLSMSDGPPPVPTDTRLTVGNVLDVYEKEHVNLPTRRHRGKREMAIQLNVLRRALIHGPCGTTLPFSSKPIDAVTRADIEAVRTWRRQEQADGRSRPGVKGGEVGTNRLLTRLSHIFSWSVERGYIEETPFRRGHVTVIKKASSVEGARTRRLEPSMTLSDGTLRDGDEARLLKHAGPHLRALIVAALSTGCRRGELLSLQWSQIRRDEHGQAQWIQLTAAKTKTAEMRVIPIGTRLRAELEMRRHGPDGKEHGTGAYVFGNEVGEQLKSIRTAWERTCKRAGIVDLHFHDLRREFACRLLESSADLHDVRDFLGHANITTTSRYLQSTPTRLGAVLARMEDRAIEREPSELRSDHSSAAIEPDTFGSGEVVN